MTLRNLSRTEKFVSDLFYITKQKLISFIDSSRLKSSSFALQDGSPVPFRYNVNHRTISSAYEPKPLAADIDMHSLRSTLFGAKLLDVCSLGGAPRSNMASVLWEVIWLS